MLNEVDDFMDRHGDELAAYLGPVPGRYDISRATAKVVERLMEEVAAILAHQVTGVAMTVYDTIASTNG